MQRAETVDEFVLGLERLAADAVEAGVDVLVDVAVVVDPLEEVTNERLVALVGRADEEVVCGVDPPRQLAPALDDLVGELLRRLPALGGHARNLRRMLVDARQEERLLAALAVMAREDIGRDRRVRVADVRRRVDVVDGCRHVEAHRNPL